MPRSAKLRRSARHLAVLLTFVAGCDGFGRKELPPEPAPADRARTLPTRVIAGTIGAQSLYSDIEPRPLRGFGLVIGLDGQGSSDCPSVIREYLIEFMNKQTSLQGTRRGRRTPGELIDSLDTAVVEVVGYVSAGARAGTRFDLIVRALPGTATRALEGGLLLPTEMRMFEEAASGMGLIAGRVLAQAGGPLFANPFASEDAGGEPRQALILGGGRCVEDRPSRLVLLQPDYQLALAIERRINERFGQRPPAAEARSRGYLMLSTPADYGREPARFRRVASHLYLDQSPGYQDRKRDELLQLAASGQVDLEAAALAWEGMGRGILPQLHGFYSDSDPELRFYAARSGARLDDPSALPVLGDILARGQREYRLLAAQELSNSRAPQASDYLSAVLDDPDQEVRLAAYEALLNHPHPAIESRQFRHILDPAQLNCILDVVDSDGPPLVYVRRTRLPRIAIFGRHLRLMPPVFYSDPDGRVTIVSAGDGGDVRLYTKRKGRMSDEILVPPVVSEVIAALSDLPQRDEANALTGLGLPYSRVAAVVAALCEDGTIPAPFVIEQASLTEILGPEGVRERPETDTDPLEAPADAEPPSREPEEAGPDRAADEAVPPRAEEDDIPDRPDARAAPQRPETDE